MNTRILLLVISAAVLSSCSTMYKSGQTPDDVYYSPGQKGAAVASTGDNRNEKGYDNHNDVSDNYLRMKSYNRDRWSTFDDDYMYWNDSRWNNPYVFNNWYGYPSMSFGYSSWGYNRFGLSYGWGYSPFYNPFYWNNPFGYAYYGTPVIIVNPKPVYRNPVANGPRTFNLNTYTSTNKRGFYQQSSGKTYNNSYSGSNAPVRVFSNSQNAGNAGRSGRYINTNSGSSQRGGYNPSRSSGSDSRTRSTNPVRTFDRPSSNTPSSGGTRSSGGSSGGSTPVRSFPRGG